MKKVVLSLLIVMFAITAAFAADATFIYEAVKNPIGNTGSTSANTPVYLDMTGTEQAEIGFTTVGVSEENKKAYKVISSYTPIDNLTGIVLTFDKTSGIASNKTINATWLIQSGQNIDLFLIGSGRMTERNSVHQNTVGWKVEYGDSVTCIDCTGEKQIGISTAPVTAPTNNGAYIYHHTPTAEDKTFKNYGSVLLNIETEDLWSKPSGYYTANLFFVICSK